jgi:hypothetical protein
MDHAESASCGIREHEVYLWAPMLVNCRSDEDCRVAAGGQRQLSAQMFETELDFASMLKKPWL